MMKSLKILYLSSYPPRKCGIAIFTQNLIENISKLDPYRRISQKVIAINEKKDIKRGYPPEVCYILNQEEIPSYEKVALYINKSGADFLFLQHEFGLFGGFDGVFLIDLLKKIKIPILTFFHTVPLLKSSKRREWRLKVLKEILFKSKGAITPSKRGVRFLKKEFSSFPGKIFHVWHGIPSISFPSKKERDLLKKKYHFQGRFVILTYGLISKNKGIFWTLDAFSNLTKKYPQILYLILGKHHPCVLKEFLKEIQKKIKRLSLEKSVKFVPSFFEEEKLIEYLKLSDVFLVPYLSREQVSSGTLSLALGCGCCCVATPFVYAKEVLQRERGFFVPFENKSALERIISHIIENPKEVEKKREKAYDFAKKLHWEKVAKKILKIVEKILRE